MEATATPASRVELLTRQFTILYDWADLLRHPIALTLLALGFGAMIYGIFFNKSKIEYV